MAPHFPRGQLVERDLSFSANEQPHPKSSDSFPATFSEIFCEQHGAVPGSAQPSPVVSYSLHPLQISSLAWYTSSTCSFLIRLFFSPSQIWRLFLNISGIFPNKLIKIVFFLVNDLYLLLQV